MKKFIEELEPLWAVIALFCICYFPRHNSSTAGDARLCQGPPIASVEKLNECVSQKVRMTTNLTGENNWYKGVWEVGGDAFFGTDCSHAEFTNIDNDSRCFTLRLPEPTIIMCRVDHERTSLIDFHSHSSNPFRLVYGNPDELRDEAMKHAQLKLEKEAHLHEHLVSAKAKAEDNLRSFYHPLGYAVTIEWQQGPVAAQSSVVPGSDGSTQGD